MFRVWYMESERGWGQKYWPGKEHEFLAEAQAEFTRCNLENDEQFIREKRVPDYYIQAERIETLVNGRWVTYS